jgi:hypothetical protein
MQPPPVTITSTSTSTPPVVAASTSQSPTPAPSDEPKKPGHPSKKSLDWIASTFAEVDELFSGLSSVTGMTRMQLIARWLADVQGPGSHTTWNTYLKYFAANKETEAARVSADNSMVHSTAFRAKCYTKYQEEVSDWQERLALFEELEMFSTKGMTVAQRNRAFRQYEAKLKKIVSRVRFSLQVCKLIYINRLMLLTLSSILKPPTSPEEASSKPTKVFLLRMRLWMRKM